MKKTAYIAFAALIFFFLENEKCFAQICFVPAVNFATDIYPFSAASADFNGDNFADLVVANGSASDVSILLGNGAGSFGAAVNFTVGTGPQAVCSADFNGDGKADLAVANQNSNNVSILIGGGTGSFGAATNFMVGTHPISIISADFNGDGFADLATANQNSGNISVLLGTGTGSFGTMINHTAGTTPFSVTSDDFDGDGKADLAVANYGSNNVSVLLGIGTGSFGSTVNYTVGPQVMSVISADFNGDGKFDLATANNGANTASVLLGSGSGSFGPAVNYVIGTTPFCIASGDFNGDSKADLVTANFGSNNVSVLLGTGSGGFKPAATFAVNADPTSALGADFNGDGMLDLAVVNDGSNNISMLLNTAPPAINISGVDSVCHAAHTILSASGAVTSFTWSANAGSVTTNTVNVNPATIAIYTVTGTNTTGCTNIQTKMVTALPSLSVVSSNSSSLCSGDTAILTASGIANYSWNTGDSVAIIKVAPGITTTYTVTGANVLGCSYTVAFTQVTFKPNIIVTSNSNPLCQDSAAVLTASGANTYTWSTAQTGSNIVITPTVTTTYTITGADTHGCKDTSIFLQAVANCVGIDQLAENSKQIVIYPNPSNGQFVIETNSFEKQMIQILDLTGKILFRKTMIGKTDIDVTDLNEGIYTVSITTNDGVITKKLMVVK